uniref:Neutral ceramidase n=1 Tax=Brassica oleracea var. oleracea TaxID=109376 RepID=A0A0D3C8A0_BRAOL
MDYYDIIGPAADVNMMGYANMEQVASGIHFRLRARTFIVSEPEGKRVVFVNIDACMASQIVTLKVIERLKSRYGDLYTEKNVGISGIHTHAGPGGYLQYVVYIVTSLGFVCELLDAGVNRSPSAYLYNPSEERSKHKYNVDKEMTLLKFVDGQWGPVDAIPRRVSSVIENLQDSREELLELASYFEAQPGRPVTRISSSARRVRSALRKADMPGFVSAFCQTNCGDVSPNVLGALCLDTGLPCDFNHSTCGGGRNELCYGRGPGYPDEFESTRIIGKRQFKMALDLFNKASEQLRGKVDNRQMNLEHLILHKEMIRYPSSLSHKYIIQKQMECHYPKPILLDTGEMTKPYEWAVKFTTMAGRRLRDAVKRHLKSSGNKEMSGEIHIVIAGLANGYSQYVTTFEEYQAQIYEGASTLFGPHIQEFKKLSKSLVLDKSYNDSTGASTAGSPRQASELPHTSRGGHNSCRRQFWRCDLGCSQKLVLEVRNDLVTIVFPSACPRNDLLTEGTFALVEGLERDDKTWTPVYEDDDLCLRFKWSRPKKLSSRSEATVEWRGPESASRGVYRITHFGAAKSLFGSVQHFTGSSSVFAVT